MAGVDGVRERRLGTVAASRSPCRRSPVDLLVWRIDRPELENRRFRRVATAIALCIAAVFLVGQTIPKSPAVETKKLVLKDKRGKIRTVLGEFS